MPDVSVYSYPPPFIYMPVSFFTPQSIYHIVDWGTLSFLPSWLFLFLFNLLRAIAYYLL